MAEGVQSSSLSPDDKIILRVYPGADGSFKGMAEWIVFAIEVVGVGRGEIQYNGDEIYSWKKAVSGHKTL